VTCGADAHPYGGHRGASASDPALRRESEHVEESVVKDRVVAFGHRFANLDIERDVLAENVEIIDANAVADPGPLLERADAVLLGTQARIGPADLDRMARCRIVVRYGIGVDNVDTEHARGLGIAVANVHDYCIDEVADHAVCLMLALSRRLVPSAEAAASGAWGTAAMGGVRRLSRCTLGLVGYGRIGRAVSQRALAFGMRVMVSDPYADSTGLAADGVEPTDLDVLLATADFVSLHCPLTPETHGLMNQARLATMQSTAYLVNTSRGPLIDVAALVDALDDGTIAGAALDVLPTEPAGADHPAVRHPKIVVTPHVAWYSEDAVLALRSSAAEVVRTVLTGGWPRSVVNEVTRSTVRAKAP